MSQEKLHIFRTDTRRAGARQAIERLRQSLALQGDVVSEAGQQRTIDVFGEPLSPRAVVERICGGVRKQGLKAVLDYSAKLDKAELSADSLRVSADELAAAHETADPVFLESVRRIRDNILRFQTAILHRDTEIALPGGGFLRQRYLPIERVGICVPGGAAAYPSTLLMTVVPARAAGTPQLAVVAPPTRFGAYNTELLATCHELGVDEVYRMGGAQAVAALAYGVQGVPGVDKVVGPGNLFVALAKRHVYGQVDIDAVAGPSEVVVLADGTARADHTAADLIAQAEHAPGSSLLLTWSERLLEETLDQLNVQLAGAARGELAIESLNQFGALILTRDVDEAIELANAWAPEHLHIATQDPEKVLGRIRAAGAVFLGHFSPVAVGDYVAGPSHVLPTGGTARFASGLSANDFLRSTSVIHFTRADMTEAAVDLQRMADMEGLAAHRASLDVRLASGGDT